MRHAIDKPFCPLRRPADLPPSRTATAPLVATGPLAPSAAGSGDPMPSDAVERILVLVLRCLSAAGETGDAICWDEALDRAEQVFGPRDGTLVVARAAVLHRSLVRSGAAIDFLPLPCRRLSRGEADLLALLRATIGNQQRVEASESVPSGARPSPETRRALADIAEAVRSSRAAVLGLRPAA